MTASVQSRDSTDSREVRLDLDGMTCASCVSRIERKLNKLDGVAATVNFATEQATVRCEPTVTVDDLVAAVEGAGYHAHPAASPGARSRDHHHESSAAELRLRLVVAVALTVPVVLMSMIPAFRFSGWEWVAFVLATPVVLWCGIGFHRAALRSARHLEATMETLISIGTLAAWGWSSVVLVGGLEEELYFEVAAVITTLILLGRYFEARAKSRSGEAIRRLLELGAKEARVIRDGQELAVPIEDVVVGDLLVVRPGEKIPTDGDVVEGESAIDQSLLTGESLPVDVGPGSSVAGRLRQHLRAPARSRDEGRSGHRARTDRPPRRGSAVGQGSRPAARGSRVGRVRPRGDRGLRSRRSAAGSSLVLQRPTRSPQPWRS